MNRRVAGEGPLVSVVTPVFNGSAYIAESVESVLRQTYTNFELTIVDNASTDETPQLASDFAARDSRIRHIRFEEFVGANENHNRAFRLISPQSEFCKVVQADDWLYPECLERMVGIARSADDVALVSAYRIWDTEVDLDGIAPGRSVLSGHEVLRQCLLGRLHVTGAPTSVLYRSRAVRERDPFYPPEFEHDDTEAAYWLLSRHNFGFVHQVLTFARRQPGARMGWAARMNTYTPENIRFLLRFGRAVLLPDEYRRQLRHDLWEYIRFHFRQMPKPSRLADPRFFELHESEIQAILAEGGNADREVRASVAIIRLMLARGAWHCEGEELLR